MNSESISSKRFGMVAMEKNYVTIEQVSEALQIQVEENMGKSIHRRIGAILFDMGILNAGQIQVILADMQSYAKVAC